MPVEVSRLIGINTQYEKIHLPDECSIRLQTDTVDASWSTIRRGVYLPFVKDQGIPIDLLQNQIDGTPIERAFSTDAANFTTRTQCLHAGPQPTRRLPEKLNPPILLPPGPYW